MRQLKHIWFIALKDLRLFATDRGALFFFILFPFLFITLFSFINIGATEDTKLKLYIVSEEAEGGLSYQIIDALKSAGDWEIIVMDYDQAYQAVEGKEISGFEAYQAAEDKKISGFIAFPADFTEGIMTGRGTQLEVVTDAESTSDRAALLGLGQTIASRIGAQYVTAKATIELLIEQGIIAPDDSAAIEQVIQPILAGGGGQAFIEYRTEKVGEVEEESNSNWVIPGYLVMFVFFGAAVGSEAIVRERQNHTLERLLASSVRREAILGGIFTGTAAKGLIQILLFWGVGILAFNVDLGNSPAAVIVLSILTVIMSAAFSIMLATLVKTQRSAGSIASLTSLVLAPLGGCWWPLFILPKWMQALAKITPHGWATMGFNKLMLFGANFGDVVPEMLALVGFTVLFSIIAIWRFRTSAVE
jgi:ABC-2 type transport system permease protein